MAIRDPVIKEANWEPTTPDPRFTATYPLKASLFIAKADGNQTKLTIHHHISKDPGT